MFKTKKHTSYIYEYILKQRMEQRYVIFSSSWNLANSVTLISGHEASKQSYGASQKMAENRWLSPGVINNPEISGVYI